MSHGAIESIPLQDKIRNYIADSHVTYYPHLTTKRNFLSFGFTLITISDVIKYETH